MLLINVFSLIQVFKALLISTAERRQSQREEDATLRQPCYLSLPVTVDQGSYDGTTFLGESISLSPSTQLPGPADDVDVVCGGTCQRLERCSVASRSVGGGGGDEAARGQGIASPRFEVSHQCIRPGSDVSRTESVRPSDCVFVLLTDPT